ncbi:hypothetical protein Bbelb_276130 [Branchiostoma belcheri]|nr:hypothetical protein Bbelb_276130 [Branchiostoma belcheri]
MEVPETTGPRRRENPSGYLIDPVTLPTALSRGGKFRNPEVRSRAETWSDSALCGEGHGYQGGCRHDKVIEIDVPTCKRLGLPCGSRLCRLHYDEAKRTPCVDCPIPPTGSHSGTLIPCPARLLRVFRDMADVTNGTSVCTACSNTVDATRTFCDHPEYAPPQRRRRPIILRKLTKARKATTDVTPTTVRRRVKEVETARKITSRGDTALQLTKELQRLPREDLQAALKAVKLDKIRIPAASLLSAKTDLSITWHQTREMKSMTNEEISNLDCNIKHFLAKYRELFPTSSVSVKMHLLEEHVIPWIRCWGVGLGFHGEQGVEQVHAVFNRINRSTSSIPDAVRRLKSTLETHLLQIVNKYDEKEGGKDIHL